ncbi:MAG: sodium:alanine symporter family protein [Clostridia bacterium]|nr:sodium:alanine symporter family protein [Clostridia bacterium]
MAIILQCLGRISDGVNRFVWGAPGLLLLFGSGVWLTCLTSGFQFTHLSHWLKETLGSLFHRRSRKDGGETGTVTQFQAMCTALAASVGVGNIAGVAAAIATGGPGAVFWMWVAALFGMMTGFSENVLGMYYRRRQPGGWQGGPMYYLRDGLGKCRGCRRLGRWLAILFALFCVLASFGMGNIGQVNAIVTHVQAAFPLAPSGGGMGVGLAVLIGIVLWGGTNRVAQLTEKLVPGMILLFLLGCGGILLHRYQNILPAFAAIFREAFSPRAAAGGVAGVSIQGVISCGFRRGMFSNEAGLGSSVLIHASSHSREPVQQGMWSIFEVFVDTLVMCTLTALVVLVSNPQATGDGTTLVAAAFCDTFGPLGKQFVAVAVVLFAFSTLLGWSQYGSRAAEYLGGPTAGKAYRVVFVLLILPGALLNTTLVWQLADTFNGLMMLPNLIGVLALSGQVRSITRNYIDRRLHQKPLPPMLAADPHIQRKILEEFGDTP